MSWRVVSANPGGSASRRPAASACDLERERRGAEAERRGDLVGRGEEALPPLAALAAPGHLDEEAQALVLPRLDHVEVRGVFLDQRFHEPVLLADRAGARAVVRRR